MNEYKDFTIVVDLKGEAITLDADSADEAIAKAKEVIKYQYGESVANDADYKLLVQQMTITRKNSGIEVSDIVNGYLVTKLYIGYTVKEAKSLFMKENGAE